MTPVGVHGPGALRDVVEWDTHKHLGRMAREAIRTMASLVEEHGYASTGESFSISDPNEVWLIEMIGKGEARKGAVWVALRVPEGHVTAHANHARIRTFPDIGSPPALACCGGGAAAGSAGCVRLFLRSPFLPSKTPPGMGRAGRQQCSPVWCRHCDAGCRRG